MKRKANQRSAPGARTVLCFHIEAHWPGAKESKYSTQCFCDKL
jgi:hypothetical protein